VAINGLKDKLKLKELENIQLKERLKLADIRRQISVKQKEDASLVKKAIEVKKKIEILDSTIKKEDDNTKANRNAVDGMDLDAQSNRVKVILNDTL
jgi:hypothetical protein